MYVYSSYMVSIYIYTHLHMSMYLYSNRSTTCPLGLRDHLADFSSQDSGNSAGMMLTLLEFFGVWLNSQQHAWELEPRQGSPVGTMRGDWRAC